MNPTYIIIAVVLVLVITAAVLWPMMARRKRWLFKMVGAIFAMALVTLTIVACGSSGINGQVNNGKITICHATSSASDPYTETTLAFSELNGHSDHKDDLIPAPVGGCPKAVKTGSNDGKITICHATGSATNPFNEITIDFNGLRGHSDHKGDIIPAPENGCASVTTTPTVKATMTGDNAGKVTICHATGSTKNPYVLITVSVNGLNGHGAHPGDIIPVPDGGCPK